MRAFAFWKKGIIGAITSFSVTSASTSLLNFAIGYVGTPNQMSIQIDQYFGGNYYYYGSSGTVGIQTTWSMAGSNAWPTNSYRATLTIYKDGVALDSRIAYFST